MADVTLRLVKGSPLTYQEVDDNFNNLNDSTGHFKNRLINGNFDFWQRGTSFTAGNVYTADRWETGTGTGGAHTISRQDFTPGQTDVPGEPKHFLRHNHTTGSSTAPSQRQKIESVRIFAGQTCTFSIWMKVSSGTLSVTPQFLQNFGTGGSPSANVAGTLTAVTVTTSWQRFSFTFDIPSISGKTIGTNNNDFLAFFVVFPASTTFTIDIAQSQAEKGSQATEFEFRPFQTELALCQRYYEKSYNLSIDPGTITSTGMVAGFAPRSLTDARFLRADFKSTKRTSPTTIWYSPNSGNSGRIFNVAAGADVTVTGTSTPSGSNTGTPTLSSSVADQSELRAQWSADAEL